MGIQVFGLSLDLGAELVQGTRDGFVLTRAKLLCRSHLVRCVFLALVVQEQLWQVLWLFVSLAPLPILWIESSFLWSTIFTTIVRGSVSVGILLFLFSGRFLEFLVLNVLHIDGFRFVHELQSDDCFDIAYVSFNEEELIQQVYQAIT